MQIKPITSAIFILTNTCNLACPYCFESHDSRCMSLDTAIAALDFLYSNHTEDQPLNVVLFGGEPLLRFDDIIVPLVEYSKTLDCPVHFSMTTNGTLLDDQMLQFFHKNRIFYMLSFDGMKSIQDDKRPMKNGYSSFDVLVANKSKILNNGLCSMIRTTLSKSWIPQFYENMNFIKSSMAPIMLKVLPNYWEQWSPNEVEILKSQIELYEQDIITSFQQGIRPLIFEEYLDCFRDINLIVNSQGRRMNFECETEQKCGLGQLGSCSIDVDGNLFACPHISPMSIENIWCIGNIKEGIQLDRIEFLRSLYDKTKIGTKDCISCPLDAICDGGCLSTNYLINKNVNNVPSTYCNWRRLITDSAYRVALQLGAGKNELFQQLFIERCLKL